MDIRFNTHQPIVSHLNYAITSLSWSAKLTSNSHSLQTSFSTVKDNDINLTDYECAFLSRSKEISDLSSVASYQLDASLRSTNAYVSPAVDISRVGVMAISNVINNDSTNETNHGGGNCIAKYVTPPTTLQSSQDSEDVLVYLTAYLPPTASINVYAKVANYQDSDTFESHSWILMTPNATVVSDKTNKNDYKEIQYNLPTSVKTGLNGAVQYTNSSGVKFTGYRIFAIKIVLLAADTSIIPLVKNLRVICALM